MAPKNAVIQSSRKAVRSASQVSITASAASGGVMTRSMTKAATTITREQIIVAAPSQSLKIQNLGSKVSNGVNQIASNVLKQKFVIVFIMPQTIPHGMDELQIHTNPAFQPFNFEDDGYSSNDSSLASSKGLVSSHAEAESSNTVIMPVMVTAATNVEEQLASMKATLDRLFKDNAEKDAQIKC